MRELVEKVLMEDMTWKEIEEAIDAGKNTVIVVAGSIEQHGPHLPISTDTTLGYALAEACAKKLGKALVAPVIRPGLSEHHIGFPGTITLSIDTFVKTLYDYCESLVKSGFKNIVILSSHGGNSDTIITYTPRIARSFMNKAKIFAIPIDRYINASIDYLSQKGISRVKAGVHAGYAETSMMLHVKPETTRMDLAVKGLADEEFYKPERLKISQLESFTYGLKKITPVGILGDPRGASAEVGKELLEVTAEKLVQEIKSFIKPFEKKSTRKKQAS
jgi:creatinine amidohydrolase